MANNQHHVAGLVLILLFSSKSTWSGVVGLTEVSECFWVRDLKSRRLSPIREFPHSGAGAGGLSWGKGAVAWTQSVSQRCPKTHLFYCQQKWPKQGWFVFNNFCSGTPSEGGAVGLASPINSLCPSCKMPFDRFCLLFDMSQYNCQNILGFKNLELAQNMSQDICKIFWDSKSWTSSEHVSI